MSDRPRERLIAQAKAIVTSPHSIDVNVRMFAAGVLAYLLLPNETLDDLREDNERLLKLVRESSTQGNQKQP